MIYICVKCRISYRIFGNYKFNLCLKNIYREYVLKTNEALSFILNSHPSRYRFMWMAL